GTDAHGLRARPRTGRRCRPAPDGIALVKESLEMSEKKRATRPHEGEPREASREIRSSETPATQRASDAADAVDWKAQAEEARDRWLRAEADLQNFRRRAARDRDEAQRTAEEAVWMEMLAVADDLERALAKRPGAEAEAWSEGVALVV